MTWAVLLPPWLLLLAVASAGLTIWGDAVGQKRLVYVFKPLTLVLVMLIAFLGEGYPGTSYKALILAGLGASLVGDVFMMLPRKRFLAGLACFLVAHGLYGAAFLSGPRLSLSAWPLVIFGFLALTVLLYFWPYLGRMRVPVLIYLVVISGMAYLAVLRRYALVNGKTLNAVFGALFFIASDALLAKNRFVKAFDSAQFLILSSYFAAQILIAFSV